MLLEVCVGVGFITSFFIISFKYLNFSAGNVRATDSPVFSLEITRSL